jgi:hypothetical protein
MAEGLAYHARMAKVAGALMVVAALGAACKQPGSTVAIPSTPGTFALSVELGTTGHGPTTPYSGPATFSADAGHFQIVCWTDATFSSPLVTLTRAEATPPGSYDVINPATAANNPSTASMDFVVVDAFTSPSATPFGGNLSLIELTATSATSQFGYSDGTYSVDGAVSAVPPTP